MLIRGKKKIRPPEGRCLTTKCPMVILKSTAPHRSVAQSWSGSEESLISLFLSATPGYLLLALPRCSRPPTSQRSNKLLSSWDLSRRELQFFFSVKKKGTKVPSSTMRLLKAHSRIDSGVIIAQGIKIEIESVRLQCENRTHRRVKLTVGGLFRRTRMPLQRSAQNFPKCFHSIGSYATSINSTNASEGDKDYGTGDYFVLNNVPLRGITRIH